MEQPESGLRGDPVAPRTQTDGTRDQESSEVLGVSPALDRATLEYIHNEWEFTDRTEEQFDEWMHGLIREARKRDSVGVSPAQAQLAPCGHERLVTESIYRCRDCGVRGPMTNDQFKPFAASPGNAEKEPLMYRCERCGRTFKSGEKMCSSWQCIELAPGIHTPSEKEREWTSKYNCTHRDRDGLVCRVCADTEIASLRAQLAQGSATPAVIAEVVKEMPDRETLRSLGCRPWSQFTTERPSRRDFIAHQDAWFFDIDEAAEEGFAPPAPTHELWLFPAEWYEQIPDGFPIIDINGCLEAFQRGKTDDDRRFGLLAYGVMIPWRAASPDQRTPEEG